MNYFETLKLEKENLTQMKEEKELEFIQALSKTSLWNKDNSPLLKEIKEKELSLEKWVKEKEKRAKGQESFKQISLSLKKVNKEIKEEANKLFSLYEKVGKLALKSYQKKPTEWKAYENIFHETLSEMQYFKNTEGKTSELIYSFLHSNFDSYNEKEVKSLKKICLPIGEKVIQLNLLNLLSVENAQDQSLIENTKIKEKSFNNLLKEKRVLEGEFNRIQKEFHFSPPLWEFVKNLFSDKEKEPPKNLIQNLKEDYHKAILIYKEKFEKKEIELPSNLEKILKEILELESKIKNINKNIIINQKEDLLKKNDKEQKKLISKIKETQKKLDSLKEALEKKSQEEGSIKLEIKETL